ncbi:YlbF family regulator [Paenibacillus agilis]|uniref:UPF0342 protein FPZ44_04125 n=1 Tax=Paenibacillus agilis TaxID=3020863 RepID=A0A559IXK4_9BACL|nr:YlbF family regulator [Paenibacillus agilis]TVX92321.1 YlbF family regulator [Paenibacillus agilis]
MTNVYDKAHDLARALQQSEEAAAVDTAMKAIAAEPETKQMFDNFRKRQVEMQQQMMTGEMPNPEEMEEMEKLFQVISMNANITALFEAERRLSLVIQDVNKIVTDSLSYLYQSEEG